MPVPPNPSTPIPIDFPYKWEEISSKLLLTSPKELPKFILAPSFLDPWADYRDLLPLKPDIAVPIIAPKDKDAMTNLVNTIYKAMDCMATSKYDRPTPSDRATWTVTEYMECLIYQAARNLAQPTRTFHTSFSRKNLRNEAGRREAFHRLRGLIMLVCNIVVNYTLMAPSNVIRRIEAARPAKNPELSPMKDVRMKWTLKNMDVDELRRKVLEGERRKEVDEKEWLIGILLGKERERGLKGEVVGLGGMEKGANGGAGGAVVKREGSVQVIGSKRAVEVVDDDETTKRSKTES
ncbi:hypothetical protein EK21DRAFT_109121 [Setomelanomma holmii]|uniref:Uncharacterized protein n=1 Tax=Setomelanomma holmii TaxID=210430 RepID=A0A9P4HGS8_9PLEO|nr:hypothetical protein EK21DRAFT_109121 [Setomelanomma holmii]